MDEIKRYFETYFGISQTDWDLFSSKLIREEFSNKKILLHAGQTENHLSFIEKGIVRQYVPLEHKDITIGFAFQGSFISAYDSFITQSPSEYCVETLQETILWRLDFGSLQEIYEKTEIGHFIGRKASEELFLKKSKREISLLKHSAEERYYRLFDERPELIQFIPLKYIASYIGVTPQALSRIRKRIS